MLLPIMMTTLFLGACSEKASIEKETAPNADTISKEPVELSIYWMYNSSSEQLFMEQFGNSIVKKYPNISFKWVSAASVGFDAVVTNKEKVDIFYGNINNAAALSDAGYLRDITPLAKKQNFNLEQVEPKALDMLASANNGVLPGLPSYLNYHVLYYNRDIFDKFGVAYPKNGMTWDETYDLARKVTRLEGGTQYVGFSHQFLNGTLIQLNSYGQEVFVPKTNKVTINEGQWPNILRTFQRFFDIPGHEYLVGTGTVDAFIKEQRLAMRVGLASYVSDPTQLPPNWDVVSLPVFSDLPKVGSGIEPIYFYLSSLSEKPNEAFAAMTAILSEEGQLTLLRRGQLPALKMPNIAEKMAQEVPSLKGKNASALTFNNFPAVTSFTKEAAAVRPPFTEAITAVMTGKSDVNTALRTAQEKAERTMEERKAAGLAK
ncbi:hypothetical protein GCM10020370_55990 [Paenibacillus hodogayensis]